MLTPELPSIGEIQQRLASVKARIAAAGGRADTASVVGVTKGFPPELAARAVEAGLTHLGENYGQELEAKVDLLGSSSQVQGSPQWHFIGGLQRNKIKRLAGMVSLWETIDRATLIDELAKRDPGARILIQVNTTGEPQKSGCQPDDVAPLVDHAQKAGLAVEGLMTVGPTNGSDPGPCFSLLARLGQGLELGELSMGMSGDFEQAVANGATIVRLGSVLFGPRPAR